MINRLKDGYSILPNELFKLGLSLKAIGLYSYLNHRSTMEQWQFSYDGIMADGIIEGIKALKSAVKELKESKLLITIPVKNGNKWCGYNWILNPTKEDLELVSMGSTVLGCPTVGSPMTERTKMVPPLISTEQLSTEKQDTDKKEEDEEEIKFLDEYIEFVTEGGKGVKRPMAYKKSVAKKIKAKHLKTMQSYQEFLQKYKPIQNDTDLNDLLNFNLRVGSQNYFCLFCTSMDNGKIRVAYESETGMAEIDVPKAIFYSGLEVEEG